MHPFSPKVTVTNLSFGNLKSIETRDVGTDGASVHACQILECIGIVKDKYKLELCTCY